MKDVLQAALVTDFPLLFWDIDFLPNDGWEPIIRRLSEKLYPLVQGSTCYFIAQCKEKFGTMRWYMSQSTDEMESLIREAEKESAVTCEDCGKPGKLTGKHWVRTLCNDCA